MGDHPILPLRRLAPGIYKPEGHPEITLSRTEGRSWSGSRGSYAWTQWTARLDNAFSAELALCRAEKREIHDHEYEIARGSTLARARKSLARYVTDRAAGSLGTRHRYGFSGDQRPVKEE